MRGIASGMRYLSEIGYVHRGSLSVCLSVCLPCGCLLFVSVCLWVCLSCVCLSCVCLSVLMSACLCLLSVCMFVFVSVCFCVCLSLCMSQNCLTVCLSYCLSVYVCLLGLCVCVGGGGGVGSGSLCQIWLKAILLSACLCVCLRTVFVSVSHIVYCLYVPVGCQGGGGGGGGGVGSGSLCQIWLHNRSDQLNIHCKTSACYWNVHIHIWKWCLLQILSSTLRFTSLSSGPWRKKTCLRGFANNTGADQPAHTRSLISAFVIRFLESTVFNLATGEISSF